MRSRTMSGAGVEAAVVIQRTGGRCCAVSVALANGRTLSRISIDRRRSPPRRQPPALLRQYFSGLINDPGVDLDILGNLLILHRGIAHDPETYTAAFPWPRGGKALDQQRQPVAWPRNLPRIVEPSRGRQNTAEHHRIKGFDAHFELQ